MFVTRSNKITITFMLDDDYSLVHIYGKYMVETLCHFLIRGHAQNQDILMTFLFAMLKYSSFTPMIN